MQSDVRAFEAPNTRSMITATDTRPLMGLALVVILTVFVGFGSWSATAPLAGAAIATGTVVVETYRKQIQHLEGGIVDDILVTESAFVAAGQPLIALDVTKASANTDFVRNQLFAERALEARLIAERDDLPSLVFPLELIELREDPLFAMILADQLNAFEERRASTAGQIAILEKRIDQYATQIKGLTARRDALVMEISIFKEELEGQEELHSKGYLAKTRLLETRREITARAGDVGNTNADIARTHEAAGETRLQISQLRQQVRETIVNQLGETREKIADLEEQLVIARDVLERSRIVSPIDGIVQNISIHTKGGVIRPGQVLMEVVPKKSALLVNALVSPLDIDNVRVGQATEVRLPSFPLRQMPIIMGTVETISPDLIMQASGEAFYLATVHVNGSDLSEEMGAKVTPGMPAEVIIETSERTLLDYLIEPIQGVLGKSLIED